MASPFEFKRYDDPTSLAPAPSPNAGTDEFSLTIYGSCISLSFFLRSLPGQRRLTAGVV